MVWFLYSAFPLKALYTTWLIYPITPIPTSTFSARSAFQLHSHTFIKCAKLILKTNGEVHEGYAFERGASFFSNWLCSLKPWKIMKQDCWRSSLISEFRLKLSPEKCVFLQTSVRYQGHVVSQNGADTSRENLCPLYLESPSRSRRIVIFSWICWILSKVSKRLFQHCEVPQWSDSWSSSIYQRFRSRDSQDQYHPPKWLFGIRWTLARQQAF